MNKLNMNNLQGYNNSFQEPMPNNYQQETFKNNCQNNNYNARVFFPPEQQPESENIPINHYKEPMKGIQEKGRVNCSFFSKDNTEKIHNNIILQVKQRIGEIISRQDDTQLYIIMRSIFLQHGREIPNVSSMVSNLNGKTIMFSVNEVIKNILQYKGYIKDISTPRTIMSHGIPTSKGNISASLSDRNNFF
jgi:hypothetical protein